MAKFTVNGKRVHAGVLVRIWDQLMSALEKKDRDLIELVKQIRAERSFSGHQANLRKFGWEPAEYPDILTIITEALDEDDKGDLIPLPDTLSIEVVKLPKTQTS